MPEIDFDKEFEKFVVGGESSAIKDVYGVLPSMSQEQMQIIHTLIFYADRYQLVDLKAFVNLYLHDSVHNKNLNMLSSLNLKSLLKAYTMDEFLHGIKVNSSVGDDK